MTSFEEKVYRIVRGVPRGRVATYKAVARAVGRPRAYRAVGNALNRNPYAPAVPCHRVVRADGHVGGFAHGTRAKIRMMKREGIEVKNGKIDLKKFGWK